MPVRLRIIALFASLVIIILGLVCGGIYYFSYTARMDTIKTKLTNRAITTGKLLGQKEIFDQNLVQRIDSLTTNALRNKTVQAYDYQNKLIYSYSDNLSEIPPVDDQILKEARIKKILFFTINAKEAIAYYYTDKNTRLVVVSTANDVEGKLALKSLLNILLISFLVGIILVLVIGYLFSSHLLQPIKKITADVEEISAQNLTRRIKTGTSKDEWYHLSSTLNELLNRLQESFELQGRFISNASHELSTPLTSISSQIEVSLQRERDANEYKEMIESIYQDVRQMSKLTQTLLEFAKASGNTGGLEINQIRIDEIILRLPAEMSRINKDYSVLVQFGDLPEDEQQLIVYGNEVLLLTAIKNIVGNSCKYAEDHQSMVHLHIHEKTLTISISNKGRIIPENEIEAIFQPFYRIEQNVKREGFGLGLSLADRIISSQRINRGAAHRKHRKLLYDTASPGPGTELRKF